MRLHVIGLPHTEPTSDWSFCAYTQKIVRFAPMMARLGWDVSVYSGPRTDIDPAHAEHVEVVSDQDWERWFAHYDWDREVFSDWEPAEWWDVMNSRAIWAIRERIQPGDLICLIAGERQRAISDAFPANTTIEPFVGYAGITTDYCAFESAAWMHWVYGSRRMDNGRMFDAVIPNYFDPTDFDPSQERDDYLLFIGRLTARKGPAVAADLAARSGMRLVVAGQGDPALAPGCEYVGVVGARQRAELMGRARAVIVPTLYVEPFGGVAVEAMLAGAPVLTTDFGAFSETVSHGRTGWRCRSMSDFLEAVERLDELDDAETIAARARSRYSLDAVGPQFDTWLRQVATVKGGAGWYEMGTATLSERSRP